MPKIRVNTIRLKIHESEIWEIYGRVNSIMDQFNSVSRNLDWDIKSEADVYSRLSKISEYLYAGIVKILFKEG